MAILVTKLTSNQRQDAKELRIAEEIHPTYFNGLFHKKEEEEIRDFRDVWIIFEHLISQANNRFWNSDADPNDPVIRTGVMKRQAARTLSSTIRSFEVDELIWKLSSKK